MKLNSKDSSFIETIKILNGKLFHISYHQKRYEMLLESFGIKSFEILEEYITPPQNGLYRCRVVYNLQNSISVTYHKYKKRDINSLKLVYNDEIEYKLKSTNREELNKAYETRDKNDDILIVKNSLITDTTIANIALLKEGVWYTPKNPLLQGTTRERLLQEGKVVQKDIFVSDIYSYERVALLNAMIDFDIISQKNIRRVFC